MGAMSSRPLGQLGLWLLATIGGNGCFLDSQGLTPGEGAGAQGGDTSTGAGDVGGGEPHYECITDDDCPDPGECSVADCPDRVCDNTAKPIDTPCGDGVSEACDGSGTCLGTAGHPCETADECLSGSCADGVCCDAVCDSACSSCSQPGLEGACTPYAAAEDPEGCDPGTCDGAGACANGVPLEAGAIGSGTGDSYVIAVDAVSPDGDAVLAGYFTATTNAGGGDLVSAGGFDIVVARLGESGTHLWSKRFGAGGDQFARTVATSPEGDVLLAGDMFGTADFGGGALTANGRDALLVKLDANGDHVWSKRFGDGSEQSFGSVAVAANGDVIAAGDFFGTIDLGGGPLVTAGNSDIAVVRLDAAGNHLWSKRFGDVNEQRLTAIAVDGNGDTWLAGYFFGNGLDFGGGALSHGGSFDVFLAKLDADGNHLFSESFGDGSDQRARAIAVGPGGEVAIVGGAMGVTDFGGGPLTSSGNFDAFVALFDDAGAPQWSRRFGDGSEQQCWGVDVDASGSVIVAGEMGGAADFGNGPLTSLGNFDVFVAKLASDSTPLWSQRYGDANLDYHNDLSVSPDGSLWVVGTFLGTVDFASGGQLVNAGGFDSFWAHLLP
jgi:hypothetical protein